MSEGRVKGDGVVSSLGDRRKGDILRQNKEHSGSQSSGMRGFGAQESRSLRRIRLFFITYLT